eukprot:30033-Rhodomonas_salina.5
MKGLEFIVPDRCNDVSERLLVAPSAISVPAIACRAHIQRALYALLEPTIAFCAEGQLAHGVLEIA